MIRQIISRNIDQPLTVAEMAFWCHMSLSTFKRRFLKLYGTFLNKWLLEQRMQKAAVLLTQRKRKVMSK
jgi:AraC-like DNA-binding protein